MKMYVSACVAMVFAGLVGGAPVRATNAQAKGVCDAAEQTIDSVKTWRELYTYSRTYFGCDNGGVAEGISDKVSQLMVHDWASLSSVSAKIRSDAAFSTFVLKHIDETWSRDDLDTAKQNAATHCPKGLDAFCKSVVAEVTDAEK